MNEGFKTALRSAENLIEGLCRSQNEPLVKSPKTFWIAAAEA